MRNRAPLRRLSQRYPIMSASIRSLRVLLDDIGTAVRASREYTRLSKEAPAANADRHAVSGFLPR
jgi:hypothetical protein